MLQAFGGEVHHIFMAEVTFSVMILILCAVSVAEGSPGVNARDELGPFLRGTLPHDHGVKESILPGSSDR